MTNQLSQVFNFRFLSSANTEPAQCLGAFSQSTKLGDACMASHLAVTCCIWLQASNSWENPSQNVTRRTDHSRCNFLDSLYLERDTESIYISIIFSSWHEICLDTVLYCTVQKKKKKGTTQRQEKTDKTLQASKKHKFKKKNDRYCGEEMWKGTNKNADCCYLLLVLPDFGDLLTFGLHLEHQGIQLPLQVFSDPRVFGLVDLTHVLLVFAAKPQWSLMLRFLHSDQ